MRINLQEFYILVLLYEIFVQKTYKFVTIIIYVVVAIKVSCLFTYPNDAKKNSHQPLLTSILAS